MHALDSPDNLPDNGYKTIFFRQNQESLKLKEALRNKLADHVPSDTTVEINKIGVPLLKFKGRHVYNETNPLADVENHVTSIRADDETTVLALFGLGLGYHAEQLERRFPCPIVVYDPSLDIIKTTLGMRSLSLQRTTIVSTSVELMWEIQPLMQFTDRKLVAAAIPLYTELFPEDFETFRSSLEKASANAKIIENTAAVRSIDWTKHSAKNLISSARRPSIDNLAKRFKGKPGILVSAGPSLDRNIGSLKKAMGNALIMAVNQSAAPLDEAQVKPNIVAVIEGLDLRAQLKDLSWLDNVVLAPTLNCFPAFFDLRARHIMPIGDNSTACSHWLSQAFGWSLYPSGGSVSCTAFSVLHSMGCDPIILVGQDLAYTNGESYANGATYGKQRLSYDKDKNKLNACESNTEIDSIRTNGGLHPMTNMSMIETTAYGGDGQVPTVAMFNLFRGWFESAAETWASDVTLINATEGGARIKGFDELPLDEVIESYCKEAVPADDIINTAIANATPNKLEDLLEIVSQNIGFVNETKETADLAVQTAKTARTTVESSGLGCADPYLRKLSALEHRLRYLSHTNQLLDIFVAGRINQIRVERHQDNDDNTTLQTLNSLNRSVHLFTVISDGAQELLDIFKTVPEQLRANNP